MHKGKELVLHQSRLHQKLSLRLHFTEGCGNYLTYSSVVPVAQPKLVLDKASRHSRDAGTSSSAISLDRS